MNILIAGGSGFIGGALSRELLKLGHEVNVLSRKPKGSHEFYWNVYKKRISSDVIANVEVLINLSGVNLSDAKWTEEQKQKIYASRIHANEFLASLAPQMPNLKHFISASGITCYGFNQKETPYIETDVFGDDYISQLVKAWEESADLLKPTCLVTKMRTSVVMNRHGGALRKMLIPFKLGFGAKLGTGKQIMPWIDLSDLVRMYTFVIDNKIDGVINAVAANNSNEEFTKTIKKKLRRISLIPFVPAFILKLMLGEMSTLLLEGVAVSNEKIRKLGFEFHFESLEDTLGV